MTKPTRPIRTLDEIAALMGKIPLLTGVDFVTLRHVAEVTSLREIAKRESVISKGSVGEHLVFVISGRFQVFDITDGGREIGLNILGPGDYFGELSIIDGLPRSASVVAMEPALIALVPRTNSLDLFHQNALVAERILKGLATKLRSASIYQTILCLPGASQRVYALLKHLSQSTHGGLTVVEHLPKQQELAIMANTSRETVSRAIKVLAENGIVEKDNHRLIVRKGHELDELASHDSVVDH